MRPARGGGKPNPERPLRDAERPPLGRDFPDALPNTPPPGRSSHVVKTRPYLSKANPPRPENDEGPPLGGPSRERALPATPDEATSEPVLGLREAVWLADRGRCVGCGRRVPRNASRWTWEAHHPLKQQTLIRRGLEHVLGLPEFAVLLCRSCHSAHHAGITPVPGHRLPPRVHEAAESLGPWAVDLIDRWHPN